MTAASRNIPNIVSARILGVACLVTVAQFLIGAQPVRAQEQMGNGVTEQDSTTDPSEITKLTLSLFTPVVAPKATIYLNATLANPTQAPVFELRETIKFPADKMTFVRARLGIAADLADSKLELVMQDASGAKVDDPETAQALDVKITAKRSIPAGPVAEFQFRQKEEKEGTFLVSHVAEARDQGGTKLPDLAFADVNVKVSKELGPQPLAVFSCFFYMH